MSVTIMLFHLIHGTTVLWLVVFRPKFEKGTLKSTARYFGLSRIADQRAHHTQA